MSREKTAHKMFAYAQRVQALADIIYTEERDAGAAHLDALAMASAALVEVATRITISACEMEREDFLYAVGEHFDLVVADLARLRAEMAN